jgi:hypothetical protein
MTRMCSNVKCPVIKNIKSKNCPECGSKTIELGMKEGTGLISAKRKYPTDPLKYGSYVPKAKATKSKKTKNGFMGWLTNKIMR